MPDFFDRISDVNERMANLRSALEASGHRAGALAAKTMAEEIATWISTVEGLAPECELLFQPPGALAPFIVKEVEPVGENFVQLIGEHIDGSPAFALCHPHGITLSPSFRRVPSGTVRRCMGFGRTPGEPVPETP